MNDADLNGFDLNASGMTGNNAVLSGGLSSSLLLTGTILIGILLQNGFTSTSKVDGQITKTLDGGTYSLSSIGGNYKIDKRLTGNIYSNSNVDSLEMSVDPSLRDGIYSNGSFGGQIIGSAWLKPDDQPGQQSVVGGKMAIGHALLGGISTSSYVIANLRGGAVLLGDGLKSTAKVDSNDLKSGRSLPGGVFSTTSVGGKYKYPAFLTGGIQSSWELGKELDINALLQGSVYMTDLMGGGLILNSVNSGGITSNSNVDAKLLTISILKGGLDSISSVTSNLKIGTVLQQGIYSAASIGGKNIIASPLMKDGIYSVNGSSVDGTLHLRSLLQGSLSSNNSLGGNIVLGFVDPQLNTWALEIKSATVLLEVKRPLSDI